MRPLRENRKARTIALRAVRWVNRKAQAVATCGVRGGYTSLQSGFCSNCWYFTSLQGMGR